MSQFFASGGQSIGVSASASVLPVNTQDCSPLAWTGWISLQSKGLSRVFSNTTFKSINSSALTFLYGPTLTYIHDYWKNHSFDYTNSCWQSDVLFNLLSRFVIAFLLRSKYLLISWLKSPSAVIWEPKKTESVYTFLPSICPPLWGDGTGYHDLHFLNVEF